MRKLIMLTTALVVMCVATSHAVVVYENDYEGETVGNGFPAWNWGNDITTHSAAFADFDGNIVAEHTGTVDNATGAAADARFGSKWDITLSGNTSVDPADYTVSYDLRNISGDWDPIGEAMAIVTNNPEVGTDQYGHGYPNQALAQADGWIHVEFNLADWSNDWWQGADWDLTQATWSLEIGQPWPGESVPDGTSFTQVWLMDNLKITMGGDTEPHDPNVTPLNDDGSVGLPISLTQAEVTLGWFAGADPDIATGNPVNPAILGHNIYLSQGIPADDPNVYLIDYIPQVHNADPNLTVPYNEYGPVTVNRGITYYWQIEEVLDDGGTGYGAGDPNNIMGALWSFDVVPATASITPVEPAYNVIDAGNNLVLTVGGTAIDTYQWYKIGDPDDELLVDGDDYSGVTTDTLTIKGVQLADEGYYYCVAENSLPSSASNRDSGPARVMTKRLMSHYPMEEMTAGVTPDVVNGFDMTMMSNDTGEDVPVLVEDVVAGLGSTYSLSFDNPPDSTEPNSVYAQYAQIDDGMVVAYEDITISAWVYSRGGASYNRIFDIGNDNGNYIALMTNTWGDEGRLRFAVNLGGTEQGPSSSAGALPTDEWTFVTTTLSGDTARLYIDGELAATDTGTTNNPLSFVPTTQNWLGRSQWGEGDGYLDGMIDDLKIYNYALAGYEVAQTYFAVEGDSVCDWENYDQDAYDVNGNCIIDLPDFAAFAARWLENDRFYPAP